MKFVCVRTCFWNTLIEEGEIKNFHSKDEIPTSVRPYFETLEKVEAEKEKQEEAVPQPVDELEALQVEADKLGITYDRRWNAKTLVFKIEQAKKGMA